VNPPRFLFALPAALHDNGPAGGLPTEGGILPDHACKNNETGMRNPARGPNNGL